MKAHWQILVVEDEEVICESLAAWLREDGYAVDTAGSGREAVEKARQKDYAIYLVALTMPGGMDGIETMMRVRRLYPEASIIMIAACATADTAIAAMKQGAREYIVKPCNREETSLRVSRILQVKNLQRENAILRKKLSRQYCFQDIIGKNAGMREALALAREVASLSSTVLIQGESGTGKGMVARAIHNSGSRAAKPFLAVSCAAPAGTLLESDLFGHERGAFNGADHRKIGKFEMANGGTIFLDEIGGIPAKLQADLLRVLQDRAFCRVGGAEEVRVDVRVIAAAHGNLQEALAGDKFRDGLLYRLNAIPIRIPPLRDRRDDIPLLANHFIERLSHELGKDIGGIPEGALRILLDYDWPGNVRELENAVERAMVTCRGKTLSEDDFSFLAHHRARKTWAAPPGISLQEIEKLAITATLQRTHGNIKESAAILGIDRSTLYQKIKRYEIAR